ncbi:TPR repeat-containing protein [Coccidioides immitis RMSCC 3703]|uniref:TPR repeat-containing protein n=1 Tax=Coccidioides immitis RMSCC 3703 TaxID=454286 RepID=A0A0J8R110_COCIT|nr:TPR repeat-containing protein [Coccidioides immitis RMSCC 3703]
MLNGDEYSRYAVSGVLSLSKYKTGIALLNATSPASLEADFGRLHDLLKLGESNNKVGSVRRWLAKPENSQWLLVFDNADNLDSVPIQKYFPAVNWGHIIITTRDQAAIGGIAEEGHVLRPLTTEDAILLLLDKSGIRHPTQGDTEDARVVVELLGSLPLALVQAGAFVRSRHRSLKEYCELYMTRRNDLLRFTSRLGDTEMAVLTAWEINFKQVECEAPDAVYLLLLFSFLEPSSIPEMLLHRGSSPQKRWATNGEVEEIRAEDEGVDESLTRVIQGDLEFDLAVEKLLSFSLISCNKESDGLRNFSIHPRVLSEYDSMALEDGEPTFFRHELAACLLAASRFSNAKWKVEAITRTKKLLEGDDDPFLNAWLAYRESSVMRMSGMSEESDRALHSFLRDIAMPLAEDSKLTQRFNAQRGDLIISFSENLIYQGKLAEAKAELIEWKSLGTEISTLEKITLRACNITLGKILRLQGEFKEALEQLDSVLQNSFFDDFFEGTGWYRVLLSEVADLRCELGQHVEAEKLLVQELAPMREKGTQYIATGRRLQMSLAETYLQRNMYAEAETLLYDLKRVYLSSEEPDFNVKFNKFRVWASLARVSHRQSHWEDALTRWKHALSALESLKMDKGFNAGLVQASIAHTLMETGHEMDGAHMLQKAKANMASESRVFWIPLFNSRWHDFIIDGLKGFKVDYKDTDT